MATSDVQKLLPSPEDPDAALGAVVALRGLADRLEAAAVATAIEQGWTWRQVAQSLGVSKQAVHKKHARKLQNRKHDR